MSNNTSLAFGSGVLIGTTSEPRIWDQPLRCEASCSVATDGAWI